ncbi:MAG: hypothetical protein AAGA80_27065, partial [Cyanobacteria bacterium P01_F01_bin.143]
NSETDDSNLSEVKKNKSLILNKFNFKKIFVISLIIFGYIFFIASLLLFASIIYLFIIDSEKQAELVRQLLQTYYEQAIDLFLIYIGVYSTLIILFISALICIIIGLRLVDLAQSVGRGTIPDGDLDIIQQLEGLSKSRKGGVDLYVTLTSLTGLPGFFTKIGISGLPLATILLTVFFAGFAIFDIGGSAERLFDFANLALGAFLGSYVQKKEKEIEQLNPKEDQPQTDETTS